MARRLMVDLASRLVYAASAGLVERPTFREGNASLTDGFAAYPEAVDLAFGPYVKFGTIIKDYRNAERPPGITRRQDSQARSAQTRYGMVRMKSVNLHFACRAQ